jgi:Ni,Fe-hydrogenase III large subunit
VAEAIAGDTVIGHGWAQCRAREALAGVEAPAAAGLLRSVALELERLSNHVGDLGALCNDVGYLPGASWFSRLRGEFLNALADLSGNRFGRGLLVPGGVRRLPGAELRRKLLARLAVAGREVHEVATLTFGAASVLARFERAGVVERVVADEIGLTGPCARASGCDRDVRRDHPLEGYAASSFPVSLGKDGDVYARALVRWLEIGTSLEWVRWGLETLPEGPASVPVPAPAPSRLAVAAVEGWRGEIVHVLATGPDGALTAAHVVDPSLRNWFGLAMALRGNPISDFPLCNKSFNLSYCGHDL